MALGDSETLWCLADGRVVSAGTTGGFLCMHCTVPSQPWLALLGVYNGVLTGHYNVQY